MLKTETPDQGGPGRLAVCATPIGNLGDLSQRVISTLRAADAILAEDTRVTRRLLAHLDIHTPLERCDQNVLAGRLMELVERVRTGQYLAFVSDAGTPGVADPGALLVQAMRNAELPVEVLPGASAVLVALVASGFTAPAFYFGGWLPRKSSERQRLLQKLAELPATLLFYESAARLQSSVTDLAVVFSERRICLARELTKLHEEVLIMAPDALLAELTLRAERGQAVRGEIVLVVEAAARPAPRVHLDKYQ
ncbi:MAG: 16S rRNA (cytidine(1402)-2'-O)-methyltransferase [Actinomycetia bacterium]|nr:16S rRNA (cytidine(1402)-2'-O)-methyltransferase [Actinomycetes bacterium]